MISYEKIKKFRSEKIGFFRFKKFDDNRYLITNDVGYFCFLNNENFSFFISSDIEKLSKEKYGELTTKLFIKSEKYENNLTKDYFIKNSYIRQGPSLHIMVLTLRCNHACKYCHAYVSNESASGKDMSQETAKKIVDTIFFTTSNDLTIEFQGGEPLLNFEVLKFVIDYARDKAYHLKKNLRFALVTNLSLMTEEKMFYLIDNNISISTSLDGDRETHNFNRTFNKGDSYEIVTKWIKRINAEYKIRGLQDRIGALVTVTKKTLGRHKELIDLYVDLGIDSIFLRPLNPYGFAFKNFQDVGYSSNEFNEFYNKSLDYILELNKIGIELKENLTAIYLQKILNNVDPNFLDERSPCGATIGQVAYNYNGNIYTCDEGRMFSEIGDESFYVGNINADGKDNYTQIIQSDVTKTMMRASITDTLPGYMDSVYKPYIGICPVHNYKKFSDVFANYALDSRIKISYNILNNIFNRIEDSNYLRIFKKWTGNTGYNKNCL